MTLAALWQPSVRHTQSPDAQVASLPEGEWPLGKALAQLQGVYILAENAQGLVVVDMHAAHERIVYERLKTQLALHQMQAQALLIPASFAATAEEIGHGRDPRTQLGETGLGDQSA
jgi:DNA mismatch repair protein MutL